ncbi:hypothetical protein M3Y96_01035600 [Aphelenchoides besseyi]|nr:hypothetical protein M3Y96_01035600 [Aphelenchoides besseyi]
MTEMEITTNDWKPSFQDISKDVSEQFAAFQSDILSAVNKNNDDIAFEELRQELLSYRSFWARKARFITIEAEGKFPAKKLKLLELDIAVQFKDASEIVDAIKYLRKNHAEEPDFRSHIERLNALLESSKDTSFYDELNSKLDSSVFLDILKGTARDTPLNRLHALISLANNPAVGMQKTGKLLFEEYMKIRMNSTFDGNEISPYDLIWCKPLYDSQLGDLDVDSALSVYYSLLKCCAVDARGQLPDEFFSVTDGLGFPRLRPRESWNDCVRLLTAILLQRQRPKLSPLTVFLQSKIDSLTLAQISQFMVDKFDLNEDEEVARLLLSYTIGMREYYEGPDMTVVLLPGSIFQTSAHAISVFWSQHSHPIENAETDIELAETLGENAEAYIETLTIARNVYTAYQKHNPASDTQIEPRLRDLLVKFHLSNAFLGIAQSMLISGSYAEAAKFISLAVRSTKDKNEQTALCFQLLQANVGMRRLKQIFQMAIELLEDEELVRETVDRSVGVFPDFRSMFDGFVCLHRDLIYHYVALLLMNASLLAMVKGGDEKTVKPMSGTIFILSLQCAWEPCAPRLVEAFEVVDTAFLANCMTLLSNLNIIGILLDNRVSFIQGSDIYSFPQSYTKFRTDGNKKSSRITPFEDLLRFIRGHNTQTGSGEKSLLFEIFN